MQEYIVKKGEVVVTSPCVFILIVGRNTSVSENVLMIDDRFH